MLAGLAATGTLATNILLPSLPQMAASLNVTSAAVTSAITIFLAVFAVGQLVVGPISDRLWPPLAGADGFAVFFAGSVWCGLATDLPNLLTGRVIQAAGACATSVLSRAIARDLFSGAALARAMALIMIAMAAAPGFSPLLGGALDHYFGWRSEFALVAAFAVLGAARLRHGARRNPSCDADAARSACDRQKLFWPDRRPPFCGAGRDREPDHGRAVRDVFGRTAHPDRSDALLRRSSSACSLPAPCMIVFASGMLATKLAPRYGLDRSIRGGLLAAATGSIAMLLVSLYSPTFLPFLGAMSVFLLGMGIVNPLGTAQALSPFGEKAGAASALVGFWQMMTAAIGVWLAATISHQALFALGVVLTVFSLVAVGLYTLRARANQVAR